MLSIITINFNNETGLIKTISSLESLKEKDFQWVFIDAASIDNSHAIAKNFAKDGDIIVSEPDLGIYNGMNKGIRLASGDKILFLNSGDTLGQTITSFHEVNIDPTADLCLYGFAIRNQIRMPRRNWWRFWSMPTSHQAIIYSRRLLEKFSFDESYRYSADFEHYLRINKRKLLIILNHLTLIVNEPYGSDQNLKAVLAEYKRALIENGYPKAWAYFVYWLKSYYLKFVLHE